MRDRLDGVSVFVEAVEAGGFARAADRLSLSRSAVGKTIARLEARLGVRLFHRTTRTQSLTEDGQVYYERCLRALEELRAGESLIESGRHEVVGRLRVSMPVLFGRRCIAPILMELAREHPRLELDLNFSDQQVDLIAQGFDLALRNGAPAQGGGLRTRKLASLRKALCASPAYLAAWGTPQDAEALVDHDALTYWREGQLHPWMLANREKQIAEAALTSRLRFDDLEAIIDAAVAGMGLAWLPYWLVRDRIEAGTLVTVLDQLPAGTIDIYALWPAAEQLPRRLRVVIDALAAQLPNTEGS